jgi:hypothetical protein
MDEPKIQWKRRLSLIAVATILGVAANVEAQTGTPDNIECVIYATALVGASPPDTPAPSCADDIGAVLQLIPGISDAGLSETLCGNVYLDEAAYPYSGSSIYGSGSRSKSVDASDGTGEATASVSSSGTGTSSGGAWAAVWGDFRDGMGTTYVEAETSWSSMYASGSGGTSGQNGGGSAAMQTGIWRWDSIESEWDFAASGTNRLVTSPPGGGGASIGSGSATVAGTLQFDPSDYYLGGLWVSAHAHATSSGSSASGSAEVNGGVFEYIKWCPE